MSATDFRKLAGHSANLSSLRGAGRLQPFPSLVFSGPAGIGKRLTAIWYAAFLNCLAEPLQAPCGQCVSCRKTVSGQHPDLHLATVPEQKTVIGVGEIREAIHQLQYAPFEGRFRVLVVENGEKLTDEAQNALLKTLEEPPKAAVLLLVTPLFGALLPTVVSRCRSVRFQALSESEVTHHLREAGADESIASSLARLCRGSLGIALGLLKNPDDLIRRSEAIELFLALPGQDLWGATDTAQRLEKLKIGPVEAIIELGTTIYRDLLVITSDCPDLVCHQSHLSQLQQQAAKLTSLRVRRLLRSFGEAELHRHSNVSAKLLLQRLCLELAKGGLPC